MLDPVAVALKFGFLAVLYLFLLWMARSALKDLRRSADEGGPASGPDYSDATGMHTAGSAGRPGGTPKLRTIPPMETGREATLNDMIAWPSAIAIIGTQDSRASVLAAAA